MKLKNKNSYLKINNIKNKKILDVLPETVRYCPSMFGFSKKATGTNVKIALLDSGSPHHRDIDLPAAETSLCTNELEVKDNNGHATIVSGILTADNRNKI
ncbi:MAG: hypothetical protein ACOCP8_09330, partial [archaeon]